MRFFKTTNAKIRDMRWVRRVKNVRNDIMDAVFRRSGHAARDAFLKSYAPRHDIAVFAIAFNTPWVIELLLAAWRKSVHDADLVIVDNSNDPASREDHRRLCAAHGIAYLPLPRNREWSANRSHGIAMNWIYYNLVSRMRPRIFGFIDHDCFPTVRVSFADLMTGKAVYGRKDAAAITPGFWSLWAGLCFFRLAEVDGKPLDFKHRAEHGMDTGGGNWWPLYSQLSPDRVGVAGSEIADDDQHPGFGEQILGGMFTHIGGASYRKDVSKTATRDALKAFLWEKYLNDARKV